MEHSRQSGKCKALGGGCSGWNRVSRRKVEDGWAVERGAGADCGAWWTRSVRLPEGGHKAELLVLAGVGGESTFGFGNLGEAETSQEQAPSGGP